MRGIEQTPWLYDPLMHLVEMGFFGKWRREIVGRARGRVLEVGCGTGRNFPLYHPQARVVGTDPDLAVLRKARARAKGIPLVAARAEALPFSEDAFDEGVSTLVLCSVDDPELGLGEIRRVLRPGGGLHLLEHVRARTRIGARFQDGAQPLWTCLTGGCRPNRDTVAQVSGGGFSIDRGTFRSRGWLRSFSASSDIPPASRNALAGAEGEHGERQTGSKGEIRRYYRTVGRFIERELASRKDAGYWRARAKELGRPSILELGAGTGRVTRIIAPLSPCLVAIDLSFEMLARAKGRLDDAPQVHLIAADMRELQLDRQFDLVLAANDPFSHLASDEDRDRAMAVVAKHLRPGGMFILDALWFPESSRTRLARPEGWRRTRPLGPPGEGYSVDEWWHFDPKTWRGRVRYEYRCEGDPVGTASFRPRFWQPEEVERRFSLVGLNVRRMLGGYDERPWDPDRARSLIVEAVRAAAGGNAAPGITEETRGGEHDEGPARPTL